MPATRCPQHQRHWFAGGSNCTRCGVKSPESIAFHARRARTDDCDGSGQIGYGRRLYPSGQAAHSKYRPCEGVGCHESSSPIAPTEDK